MLSEFPQIKSLIKNIYVRINAHRYKKNYRLRIFNSTIDDIYPIVENERQESFFGYYDKSPINSLGWIISHKSRIPTKKLPDPTYPIDIVITNAETKEQKLIGSSNAYNWQQGSRTHWLDDDHIIYNDFDSKRGMYISRVFSLTMSREVKTFDMPVQDSYGLDFYLSVNYSRIMNLRPDYGYRNLPLLSKDDMEDLRNDGIFIIDYNTGESSLLHSLSDVVACETKDIFGVCLHKVNHLMINKNGQGFIFIHRFYKGKRRIDRLIYSDFKTLRVLVDDGMVSHCCWVNESTIFGYFKVSGKDGYYFYNIETNQITECKKINDLLLGDGHPSCHGDWIVFDTYPDKSRMQKLMLYNAKTEEITPLLEVHHGLSYMGQNRCDLHPRFSRDGNYLFFDSVFTGTRNHYWFNVKNK